MVRIYNATAAFAYMVAIVRAPKARSQHTTFKVQAEKLKIVFKFRGCILIARLMHYTRLALGYGNTDAQHVSNPFAVLGCT